MRKGGNSIGGGGGGVGQQVNGYINSSISAASSTNPSRGNGHTMSQTQSGKKVSGQHGLTPQLTKQISH